jgi:hypothetical protein
MPKFLIGDLVMYVPIGILKQTFASGTYKVLQVMPFEDNQTDRTYRIRNDNESADRIAEEGDLIAYT